MRPLRVLLWAKDLCTVFIFFKDWPPLSIKDLPFTEVHPYDFWKMCYWIFSPGLYSPSMTSRG